MIAYLEKDYKDDPLSLENVQREKEKILKVNKTLKAGFKNQSEKLV